MPRRVHPEKPNTAAMLGPIKPGSTLYRALEIIAREVAKSLETKPPPKAKRQRGR
jgi:hypothetical protein